MENYLQEINDDYIGCLVSCKIHNQFIAEALIVKDETYYLCQDIMNGTNCNSKGNYKYSWSIQNGTSKSLSNNGVTEIRIISKEQKIEPKNNNFFSLSTKEITAFYGLLEFPQRLAMYQRPEYLSVYHKIFDNHQIGIELEFLIEPLIHLRDPIHIETPKCKYHSTHNICSDSTEVRYRIYNLNTFNEFFNIFVPALNNERFYFPINNGYHCHISHLLKETKEPTSILHKNDLLYKSVKSLLPLDKMCRREKAYSSNEYVRWKNIPDVEPTNEFRQHSTTRNPTELIRWMIMSIYLNHTLLNQEIIKKDLANRNSMIYHLVHHINNYEVYYENNLTHT